MPSNIDARSANTARNVQHSADKRVNTPPRYIARNGEAVLDATAAKLTDGEIYDCIYDAILSRRLQPGARLVEGELARLFGVSRTKIRPAIAKLTQDGVVQTRRNFGASVAAPSRAEAGHIMEFRRMLEPPVAAALARARPHRLAILRPHLAAEHAARQAG